MNSDEFSKWIEQSSGRLQTLSGNCAVCRKEKPLPVVYNDRFICQACYRLIEKSEARADFTQCATCLDLVVSVWGKTDQNNHEFTCLSCINQEFCGICGQCVKCPYITENPEGGYLLMCQSCQDENELLNAADTFEHSP